MNEEESKILPAFVGFPRITRLSRECVITEKIDGTNAVVHVTEANQVIAGSRNGWLAGGKDNFEFAAWVKAHEDELRGLGTGYHFGEWWGSGIQRGYGLPKGERRFSLFSVHRWADDRDTRKFWVLRPECCHVVPVLYTGPFDTAAIEGLMLDLAVHGSYAAPGFMRPEGIVVWHGAAHVMFKKTLDGDGNKHKHLHSQAQILETIEGGGGI